MGLEGSAIQSITKNFTEKTHLLDCSDGLKAGALRSWASFVGMEAEAVGPAVSRMNLKAEQSSLTVPWNRFRASGLFSQGLQLLEQRNETKSTIKNYPALSDSIETNRVCI